MKNNSWHEENDDKSRRKPREQLTRTSSRVGRSSFTARVLFATFTYVPDVPENLPIQNNNVPIKRPVAAAAETLSLPEQQRGEDDDSSLVFGEPDLAALHLPVGATSVILDQVPPTHPMQKNPIVAVLKEARISEIAIDDWMQLPGLARNLTDLYGSRIVSNTDHDVLLQNNNDAEETGPIVLGMETCEEYRRNVPSHERYVGNAGMFNTGTNALENHLRTNIEHSHSSHNNAIGKHRMPYRRLDHVAPGMEKRDQTKCLPVVIIRDPYHWMQSMCKSAYAAHWKHGSNRCPNLSADETDLKRFQDIGNGVKNATTFRVKVIFGKDDVEFFDSLVDLWSEWYSYYLNATYPHLIIRFEDMLLQAPAVLSKIAECVGAGVRNPIQYQTGSAKAHGSHTDFLKAILKSADAEKRSKLLAPRDLAYAAKKLDRKLLDAFHYKLIT
eukprot:scaffold2574_cov168-Amphora_coffeaeformis.AAC.3